VQKKALIEKAAIKLFASKGIVKTTTRDIAQAASVSEGALYRHWPSKDKMAWDLYCQRLEKFITKLRPAMFEAATPLADRLGFMVEAIYKFYKTHNHEFAFILLTARNFPQNRYPQEHPYVLLSELLDAEIAGGRLPPCNTATLAAMVLGAILEPVIHHRLGYSQAHPIDSGPAIGRACMALIVAFGQEDTPQ
jgi:AcrR family transcriptional regulator